MSRKDILLCFNLVYFLTFRYRPNIAGIHTLKFTIMRAYQVEILLVRTCHVAYYGRNRTDSMPSPSTLEIRKVHDMTRTNVIHAEDRITAIYEQHPGDQQLGVLPTWFEASIQSKLINQVFQQNRSLEFGEEVEWSTAKLQKAGAFDDLIISATELVKKIDRVGSSGNNHQDVMTHGTPPTASVASLQHNTTRDTVRDTVRTTRTTHSSEESMW